MVTIIAYRECGLHGPRYAQSQARVAGRMAILIMLMVMMLTVMMLMAMMLVASKDCWEGVVPVG